MGNNKQQDGSGSEKVDWKKYFLDWKNPEFSQNVPAQLVLLAVVLTLSYCAIHASSNPNTSDNKQVVVATEPTTNQPDKKPVVVAKHGESTDKASTAKEQNPGSRGADKPKQATMSTWDYMKEYLKRLYNELVR